MEGREGQIVSERAVGMNDTEMPRTTTTTKNNEQHQNITKQNHDETPKQKRSMWN